MAKQFVNLNNLDVVWDEHSKDIEEIFDHFEAVAEAEAVENGEEPTAVIDFSTDKDESGNTAKRLLFKFGIPKGDAGPQGEKGERGDPGPQGEKGDANFISRNVVTFCSTSHLEDDKYKPSTPVGGSWDPVTDVVNPPTDPDNKVTWVVGNTDIDGDDFEPPVWSSNGWINHTAGKDPIWERPIQISGRDGKTGQDGASIEFIFARTDKYITSESWDKSDWPDNDKFTPDYIPTPKNDIIWYDHPLGITEDHKIEWMCSRMIKDTATGEWGEWNADESGKQQAPQIWSWWGRSGKDGDGVQYIFMRNDGSAPSIDPTPTDWATNDAYQDKYEEYVPDEFTDNAPSPTSEEQVVWVWVRKYKFFNNDRLIELGLEPDLEVGGKYLWDVYNGPSLWSRYGMDGNDGIYQESRYCKTNSTDPDSCPYFDPNSYELSGWTKEMPKNILPYEAVWEIQAWCIKKSKEGGVRFATAEEGIPEDSDGNPIYGWQGPWIKTGIKGDVPQYKEDVFKFSDIRPDAPDWGIKGDGGKDGILPNLPEDGWEDYPNREETLHERWWRCVLTIDGSTNKILSYSTVIPMSGQDGSAQDGRYTKTLWAEHSSSMSSQCPWGSEKNWDDNYAHISANELMSVSELKFTDRVPVSTSTIDDPKYLYFTTATIEVGGYLSEEGWSYPYRTSGLRGETGNTGPKGEPGYSFTCLYAIGNYDEIPGRLNGQSINLGDKSKDWYPANQSRTYLESIGWNDEIPADANGTILTNEKYPYVFCIQSPISFEWDDQEEEYVSVYSWSNPIQLSGIDGQPGAPGTPGWGWDTIYCAGYRDNKIPSTQPSGNISPAEFCAAHPMEWFRTAGEVDYDKNIGCVWACDAKESFTLDENYTPIPYYEWEEPYQYTAVNGGIGIEKVDEYYLVCDKSEGVRISDYTWSKNEIPAFDIASGKVYLWNYEVITYDNDDKEPAQTEPAIIGYAPKDGRGIKEVREYYAVSSLNKGVTHSTSGLDWKLNEIPPYSETNIYLWNYEVIVYDDGEVGPKSQPALIGGTGGRGIESIEEWYKVSRLSSGVTKDNYEIQNNTADDWKKNEIPPFNKELGLIYLWNFEKIIYDDGTYSETPVALLTKLGEDGRGIESITESYLIAQTSTKITTSNHTNYTWYSTPPTPTKDQPCLWNKETITYTTGSPDIFVAMIGQRGEDGTLGRGISGVDEYYLRSNKSSGVTTSTTGWTKNAIPTLTTDYPYLWNYEIVRYDDGTSADPTTPAVIGSLGSDGRGISSVVEKYLASEKSSGVTTSTTGWSETIPTLTNSKRYLWNWERVNYTDNTKDDFVALIGQRGEDGKDGVDGVDGPPMICYPAGNWSSSVTYSSTLTETPYVFYEGSFYILKPNLSNVKGTSKGPGNTTYWTQAQNFDAIYAKLLFADYADIGPAIFTKTVDTIGDGGGGYMLSKCLNSGSKISSGSGINYTDPTATDAPRILLNFHSGAGHLAKGNLSWTQAGNVKIGGNVNIGGNVVIGGDANDTGHVSIRGSIKTDWKTGGGSISISNGIPVSNLIQITSSGTYDLPDDEAWIGMELTVLNESSEDVEIGNVTIPRGYTSYSIPSKQVARFVRGASAWYTYREAVMIQEEETWPNGFSIHVPYYRLSAYQSQTYEFYATRKSSYGNTETLTTEGTWTFKIDNPTWFSMSQDKNKLTVTFNSPSSVPTSDRASQSYINVIFTYNGVESYAGSSVGLSWQ